MNETTKESKFLNAITRYAEQQKQLIGTQLEEYKAQKIEQATETGLQDAYDLIQRDIAERKAAIVTEYAQKAYALKKELYAERQHITDEVFAEAERRVSSYTSTPAYRDAFLNSAKRIAEAIGDSACTIMVCARDSALAREAAVFFRDAQTEEDSTVRLGGFKVLCEENGVLIDDTLDSKLSAERAAFPAYAGLKVV